MGNFSHQAKCTIVDLVPDSLGTKLLNQMDNQAVIEILVTLAVIKMLIQLMTKLCQTLPLISRQNMILMLLTLCIGNYTVREVLMKNRTRVWRNVNNTASA